MTRAAILKREAAEYTKTVDLTRDERQGLNEWIKDGNSVHDNPWHMADESGRPMDFITALRFDDGDFIFDHGNGDETVGDDVIF